ncbi:hypothetical protein [Streptomyces sp. NPDC057910]|uniref:hypothetical protein n=1 Tax=Streptomyces sp. NPDC057910 TaxID=3346278 RepID=UPI0036ED3D4D
MRLKSLTRFALASSAAIGIAASSAPAYAAASSAPAHAAGSSAPMHAPDQEQGSLDSKHFTVTNNTTVPLTITEVNGSWENDKGHDNFPVKGQVIAPLATATWEAKRNQTDEWNTVKLAYGNLVFDVRVTADWMQHRSDCNVNSSSYACDGFGLFKSKITLEHKNAFIIKNDTNMDLRIESAPGKWFTAPKEGDVLKPGGVSAWRPTPIEPVKPVALSGNVAPGMKATYTIQMNYPDGGSRSTCEAYSPINNINKPWCSGDGIGGKIITLHGRGIAS